MDTEHIYEMATTNLKETVYWDTSITMHVSIQVIIDNKHQNA